MGLFSAQAKTINTQSKRMIVLIEDIVLMILRDCKKMLKVRTAKKSPAQVIEPGQNREGTKSVSRQYLPCTLKVKLSVWKII